MERKFEGEVKYHGFHACLKLWESRPDDVIRVYVQKESVHLVKPLLKWCASKNKAYHVIPAEEMCAVSQSVHHEGLCILAREVASVHFNDVVKSISQEQSTCLVYLDGVQNPHNIGSIMRLCAHFGVRFILVAKSHYTKISPSAYRVAQGGAEYVQLVPIESFSQAYDVLKKKGFQAVASSSHQGKTLYEHRFCNKTLVVMGSETAGISKKTLAHIQETLLIPGTGWVESLNVSVATALFIGEFWRQVGKR